jgi:hypothetical protein
MDCDLVVEYLLSPECFEGSCLQLSWPEQDDLSPGEGGGRGGRGWGGAAAGLPGPDMFQVK